jgi:hypothetical protein
MPVSSTPTGDFATDLAQVKTNLTAALLTISASPKPSYNIDGQQISWTEYMQMLLDQIKAVDAKLAAVSPEEVVTEAYP